MASQAQQVSQVDECPEVITIEDDDILPENAEKKEEGIVPAEETPTPPAPKKTKTTHNHKTMVKKPGPVISEAKPRKVNFTF